MYTIQILSGGEEKRNRVMQYLNERLAKDGRFTAKLTPAYDKGLPSIHVKPVRLTKSKPYCGQHPDVCVAHPIFGERKKPNSRLLEWNDWVKFHNLVNKALNRLKVNADVWSNPADVRGKMLIRKGLRPRIRWDYTTDNSGMVPIHAWNQGTDDQF